MKANSGVTNIRAWRCSSHAGTPRGPNLVVHLAGETMVTVGDFSWFLNHHSEVIIPCIDENLLHKRNGSVCWSSSQWNAWHIIHGLDCYQHIKITLFVSYPDMLTTQPSLVENSGMTCIIYGLCLQSKSKSRVAFLWEWFMSSLLYGMSHAPHCSKSRHLITARYVFDNLFDQSVRGYWRNFWWCSAWHAEKMCWDV